jgi:thiamine biosynthesis lipoprotein
VLAWILAQALACAGAEPIRLEAHVDAMGATYTVVVYGAEEAWLRTAIDDAVEEVRRLDRLLSNYQASSEWSQVNSRAAQAPVKVSGELFDLVAACVNYSRESDGAFDITVGPLMKVWGFYKGSGRVPHRAEIRGAMARVGYRNILLDRASQTIKFAREGIEMDPGGIGKGYAVDRMVEKLKQQGVESAFVSAGSSSLYGLGTPPSEPRGWRVEIRHPKDASRTASELFLKNESMSTSGNYEKFFYAGGRIYSHIMDPRTGYPAEGMLSVSVVAPRTIDSEAWTKPYYIRGREWAAHHRKPGFRVFLCEDKPGSNSCAWLQ